MAGQRIATVEHDSPEARDHPLIREFVELVDASAADGVLTLKTFQTPPFMKCWESALIYDLDDDRADLTVRFFGSRLVDAYDRDCTGGKFSDMGYGEHEDYFQRQNLAACLDGERTYVRGRHYWNDKNYFICHQVKMPLRLPAGTPAMILILAIEPE